MLVRLKLKDSRLTPPTASAEWTHPEGVRLEFGHPSFRYQRKELGF